MRKRLINDEARGRAGDWLDLETMARVEITSEEAEHPIESALTGAGSGWRASRPGDQIIRLLFDEPLRLRRICLEFYDEIPRTQEFVLRWSPDQGRSYREIVRQQYRFSPPNTTREIENYAVDLREVTLLELRITPDIHRTANASLAQLRLA
jgi:hypothetical protein